VLWFRVARREGAHPSALRYTLLGAVVAPVTIVAAMFALALFAPLGLASALLKSSGSMRVIVQKRG